MKLMKGELEEAVEGVFLLVKAGFRKMDFDGFEAFIQSGDASKSQ